MIRAIRELPPPTQGPAQGAGRAKRVLPFAAIGAAALLLFVVSNTDVLSTPELMLLLGGVAALCAAWALVPWDSLPRGLQVVLPLGAIAIIVMMQVLALPNDRDLGVLLLLPVLWAALYGSAREALAVLAAAVTAILAAQGVAASTDISVGFTGSTEAVALSGCLVLIAWFTVNARTHARIDALTRIPNRRAWDEALVLELDRARRHPGPVALAVIDLDRFKQFNDSRGHAEGDRHLAACAEAWGRCLRTTDVLARVGGEEFAVLLVGADQVTASEIVTRMARAVPHGQTCSIGLALWDGAETAPELMARADAALYAAKDAGRDRITLAPRVRARTAMQPTGAAGATARAA